MTSVSCFEHTQLSDNTKVSQHWEVKEEGLYFTLAHEDLGTTETTASFTNIVFAVQDHH